MRILAADDDPVSRTVVTGLLEKAGHQIVSCADGPEALNVLNQDDPPRLAILNWMMPGMTGLEVCQKVRSGSQTNLPYIIFVTGRDRTEDVIEGLKGGGDDYVTKPFDPEELLARVGVGIRMVELRERLVEAERAKVVLETAGAAAHEINQPLTVLTGTLQLMMEDLPGAPPARDSLEACLGATDRIADIVRKMRAARRYVTRPYLRGTDIVDFEEASQDQEEEQQRSGR